MPAAVMGAKVFESEGEEPRRPMIDGSRWCSCGMALKRWVTSRAPWASAVPAIVVVATLIQRRLNQRGCAICESEMVCEPVPDGEHDSASRELRDALHHALHLRGRRDDAHADFLAALEEPVFRVHERGATIDLFEALDAVGRRAQEGRGVRPAFRGLEEGAFAVPSKEVRTTGGG